MELRDRRLNNWWQDKLNAEMEKHFPDIIAHCTLVESYKVDGWNDGTTTLYGVYQLGVKYTRCVFPDYGEPKAKTVTPVFAHVGWETPNAD